MSTKVQEIPESRVAEAVERVATAKVQVEQLLGTLAPFADKTDSFGIPPGPQPNSYMGPGFIIQVAVTNLERIVDDLDTIDDDLGMIAEMRTMKAEWNNSR